MIKATEIKKVGGAKMKKRIDYSYLTATNRFNAGNETELDYELEAYRKKKREKQPKTVAGIGKFLSKSLCRIAPLSVPDRWEANNNG